MRETPTQQPPPGTPNESWCWGGSSRSIPRVPWTTNGGTSMGMSGGIRAGSPLPSVRNQRKNQPLPLPATRIWGFFPSFPFLLPPPPPFVSLFLSKDTRSCSNLFSWPNPAGLSSAGCVCKEKTPPKTNRAGRRRKHQLWNGEAEGNVCAQLAASGLCS